MAIYSTRNNIAYGLNNALQNLSPLPIISQRAPSSSDVGELGQLWVYNNNVWVFTSTGTWTELTGGSSGSDILNYTLVGGSSPYVVQSTDDFIGVPTSSVAYTIQLPDAPVVGRWYVIKDITGNAVTHNITLTTVSGSVNIDGATTFIMNSAHESVNVLFSGSQYFLF